jgi:hypothetical protein
VDALLLEVVEKLGSEVVLALVYARKLIRVDLRRVVGVEFDLVNGRRDLGARVGKKLLKVLDPEVGDTNVLHTARLWELLHFSPGIPEVPVGVMLAKVIWVG